jgi:hypothetical protein
VKKAAYLERRVAPAPPSRSAAKESHSFAHILPLSVTGRNPKNQSLWCLSGKGYAEAGTFYVTSITLIKVSFTLLEAIGSLSPLGVAFITYISDVWATAEQLDQVDESGNETVTREGEPLLDNLYTALKESGHETAENGSSGVRTTTPNHSTLDIMAPDRSDSVLGARLPRLSGSTGRNVMGAKKAPSELARTGGASLCHPSTRGVVKAIPQIHAVRWFPAASYSDADMETVSLRADLSWWKSANNEDRSAPERCADVQGLTHLEEL